MKAQLKLKLKPCQRSVSSSNTRPLCCLPSSQSSLCRCCQLKCASMAESLIMCVRISVTGLRLLSLFFPCFFSLASPFLLSAFLPSTLKRTESTASREPDRIHFCSGMVSFDKVCRLSRPRTSSTLLTLLSFTLHFGRAGSSDASLLKRTLVSAHRAGKRNNSVVGLNLACSVREAQL